MSTTTIIAVAVVDGAAGCIIREELVAINARTVAGRGSQVRASLSTAAVARRTVVDGGTCFSVMIQRVARNASTNACPWSRIGAILRAAPVE